MTIEKKTIRSDIPGSHVFLNGNIGYVGSTTDEARRLVVAREVTLTGQIANCQYLVIEGTVLAETFAARRLDILESGLFNGTADLQECVIAGRFEGKLRVQGRLTLKPTAQVFGEIEYSTLEVEAGARMEGRIFSNPMVEEAPLKASGPLTLAAPESNIENFYAAEREPVSEPDRFTTYRRAARA
jgi:cytoskeletal protein CcmA (bactofilin family)